MAISESCVAQTNAPLLVLFSISTFLHTLGLAQLQGLEKQVSLAGIFFADNPFPFSRQCRSSASSRISAPQFSPRSLNMFGYCLFRIVCTALNSRQRRITQPATSLFWSLIMVWLRALEIHWRLANHVVEDEQTKTIVSTQYTFNIIYWDEQHWISVPVSVLDSDWQNLRDSIVLESILSSKGQFASSKLSINRDTSATHKSAVVMEIQGRRILAYNKGKNEVFSTNN